MASLPSLAVAGTLYSRNPSPTSLLVLPSEKLKEEVSILYVPLLRECAAHKSLANAETLHGHMIKTGTPVDHSLVDAYMKCGACSHAQKLFDAMADPRSIVTWTALIAGYVGNSQPVEGVRVFVQLLLESEVSPNNYTVGAVLNACCSLCSGELGEQVHGYVIKHGMESDTSTGNSLCSMYAKCGNLESAIKSFGRIQYKNVISWTTIISGCGEPEMGLKLFVDMLSENIDPNEFTLTSALSQCCSVRAQRLGRQVHSLCIKKFGSGCEMNLPVKNSVMYLYLKCGELDDARRLFDGGAGGLISWNAMIAGHAQMMGLAGDDVAAHRSGTEALKVFLELNRSSSIKPDLFSFSSVLTICSGLAALEQGEQIHAQSIKTGFLSDVVVSTALVNMYNKCGCIEQASKAFVEMRVRTTVSWTSMITAYSQHGRSKEAIQLFEDMRFAGVQPNQVTFVGVLSACSRSGTIEEAEHYFAMMRNKYMITPVMVHYACMADMYVRLGRMEDAFAFVNSMDFEPNEIVWSILIAGCRSHGKLDLGFYAADRLLQLKPKGTETYMLLLNMYLSAERWEDIARVRTLMKEENIGCIRDQSWISIKEKVHFFGAEEKSQGAAIHQLLENLIERAQGIGYVPYKSTGRVSVHHSERLAIAFGLMNTPEGAPVRIVKNIGMCRDCHSSVKFFSILTRREIIVRDSKRLHKFKDGCCSCGDFSAIL